MLYESMARPVCLCLNDVNIHVCVIIQFSLVWPNFVLFYGKEACRVTVLVYVHVCVRDQLFM